MKKLLLAVILFPLLGVCQETDIVSYHNWLKYRELPFISYPIATTNSATALLAGSQKWGYSVFSALDGAVKTDPLLAIRYRTPSREELNPVDISSGSGFLWQTFGLDSDYSVSQGRRIKMISTQAGNDLYAAKIKLVNDTSDPWLLDLIFYMKGESFSSDEVKSKRFFTAVNKTETGLSAVKFSIEKSLVQSWSTIREEDCQRLLVRLSLPPAKGENAGCFIAAAGAGLEPEGLQEQLSSVLDKDIEELAAANRTFFNKMLMKLPKIVNTSIDTREYYQGAYLTLTSVKKDDELVRYNLKFYDEPKIKDFVPTIPWLAWRLYETYGDVKALQVFFDKAVLSGIKEPETAAELYDLKCLSWMAGVLGREKPSVKPKPGKFEDISNEDKLLYVLLEKYTKADAEKAVEPLLYRQSFKYPEVFFCIDTLLRYGERDLAGKLCMAVKPYNQRLNDRNFTEIACSNELFLKTCGLDFSRGNLVIQPFELYHELWKRTISGLKYRGNTLNLSYRGSGRFVEKVLVNGDNYSTRFFTVPEGLNQTDINIEVVLSDRPVQPILYSVKSSNAYAIKKCGYDEKAGTFNIDMDKLPDENVNCTFGVRSNGKKVNKVTINWKDISKYSGIKAIIK